jgi:hypothetical protein
VVVGVPDRPLQADLAAGLVEFVVRDLRVVLGVLDRAGDVGSAVGRGFTRVRLGRRFGAAVGRRGCRGSRRLRNRRSGSAFGTPREP